MVSLELTTSVFLYSLFSLHVWSSHAQKGAYEMPVTDITGTAGSASSTDKLQQIRVEVHSMREVGEHAWLGRRQMKMRKALGGDSTARGPVTSTREASEISGASAGSVAGTKSVAYDKLTLRSKADQAASCPKKLHESSPEHITDQSEKSDWSGARRSLTHESSGFRASPGRSSPTQQYEERTNHGSDRSLEAAGGAEVGELTAMDYQYHGTTRHPPPINNR